MKYFRTIKDGIKNLVLGGLMAVLPLTLLIFLFKWIIDKVVLVLTPIVSLFNIENQYMLYAMYVIVFIAILIVFMIFGFIVRTRLGRYIDDEFEEKIIKKIPGYTIIKDTVKQFFGTNNSFFSEVVLVRIFDSKTYMTGFVTDKTAVPANKDVDFSPDYYTVFVPTGPNPTSGNIYHVNYKDIKRVDISVEEAMKSIISCGCGSAKLTNQLLNNK